MATVCQWMIVILLVYSYTRICSSSIIDSSFLNRLDLHLSSYSSLNKFYNNLLEKVRHYRPIDTVYSPINLSRIESNNYDGTYLNTSCYQTGFDLLRAHGYSEPDVPLTIDDIQSLLPALLYSIENPGCQRLPPARQRGTLLDVWLFGVILLLTTKLVHLISMLIFKNKCSTDVTTNDDLDSPSTSDIRFISTKSRLWFCLGFNAFTCGLILGTIIYHLIPQIYEIPNENFDYMYLVRATIVFCGVYLFFIVEKLLRLRFKIDEMPFDEPLSDTDETATSTDADMLRMAKMYGTLHVGGGDDTHHKHRVNTTSINVDSGDDDADGKSNQQPLTKNNTVPLHHHSMNDLKTRTRNLIFYHLIYDMSNDLIFGCGLATALAQNRLIALILWLVIFAEGFRRHLQISSSLSSKLRISLLLTSIIFILIGYLFGGFFADIPKPMEQYLTVIRAEYIYSIIYGTLFYSALVTLIPELTELGQHLQTTNPNQTSKQRHWMKTCVLLAQNLFLLIGVLLTLILAFVWRRYHRISILNFVCTHDSSHSLCSQHHLH